MSRSRSWVFTLNNYSPEDELSLESCDGFRYVLYGREVGESGTPHLQGFVYCKSAVVLSYVRERIPRAHWEVSRGTTKQACDYCKKDGDFVERGDAPVTAAEKGAAEAERWEEARKVARLGDIESIPADIYVRYYRTLKEIAKDHMCKPPDHDALTGIWIWGIAGCGKSRRAREEYAGAYLKMANKWWDGYQGEENVIIDDLDKKHDCLGHHLKIWGDRYSFLAETKGGALAIRPKCIVVTSQYSIEDIWEDEETRAALNRRYTIVKM